jgi:hypothetical protein
LQILIIDRILIEVSQIIESVNHKLSQIITTTQLDQKNIKNLPVNRIIVNSLIDQTFEALKLDQLQVFRDIIEIKFQGLDFFLSRQCGQAFFILEVVYQYMVKGKFLHGLVHIFVLDKTENSVTDNPDCSRIRLGV